MPLQLRSLAPRAILAILLLMVSPILPGDRALAQVSQTVHQMGHAQSRALHKEVQESGQEEAQATGDALFKTAEDLAGSACSRTDLERVVEKYQEFLRLSDTGAHIGSAGRAFLELGRFDLYLKKYDEAETSLAQALKMFAAQRDATDKVKALADTGCSTHTKESA